VILHFSLLLQCPSGTKCFVNFNLMLSENIRWLSTLLLCTHSPELPALLSSVVCMLPSFSWRLRTPKFRSRKANSIYKSPPDRGISTFLLETGNNFAMPRFKVPGVTRGARTLTSSAFVKFFQVPKSNWTNWKLLMSFSLLFNNSYQNPSLQRWQ